MKTRDQPLIITEEEPQMTSLTLPPIKLKKSPNPDLEIKEEANPQAVQVVQDQDQVQDPEDLVMIKTSLSWKIVTSMNS